MSQNDNVIAMRRLNVSEFIAYWISTIKYSAYRIVSRGSLAVMLVIFGKCSSPENQIYSQLSEYGHLDFIKLIVVSIEFKSRFGSLLGIFYIMIVICSLSIVSID